MSARLAVEAGVVAHVPRRLTASSLGGTERLLAEVLPRLRRRGLGQRILTTTCLDDQPDGEFAGVPVQRHAYAYPEWPLAPQRRAALDRKGGNLVSRGLARALRGLPDLALVHLHTGGRLGAQALAEARRRRVPCVLTLHGGHFAIPPQERADLAARRGRSVSLSWGRALTWWLSAHRLLERVDAVICVGPEEHALASARLPRQRVRLLPGGVDAETFAAGDRARGRALLGVDPARRLLVCVARLDRQKDQATLVRAWRRLGDAGCDLALVGPETSPGYGVELLAASDGAPGRLLLPGNIEPAALPDVYAAADLAVLPSRHEPFGLACLEAWAAGACLVAAASGGPAWLLGDGSCGVLFPPGDDAGLAELLRALLADPGRRAALAAAGRARARAEFTWDAHVERLLAIYREAGLGA